MVLYLYVDFFDVWYVKKKSINQRAEDQKYIFSRLAWRTDQLFKFLTDKNPFCP